MNEPRPVLHAAKDVDADGIPYATTCLCPIGHDHWTETK